jgi:sugar phosphate permease
MVDVITGEGVFDADIKRRNIYKDVRGSRVPMPLSLPEVGIRARRHVALRLLPFVFLIYVVNYIDRVNVSFANLRMSADLGFSDRVYGLGVGMFYLTYVLFEIPGAVIVERWSARKWIARIMISWGVVTILTGFVHSAAQFYAARFFLGLTEASFFPGMIVYLTHWFCSRDRGRAIACLYTAVPTASLIGSPIAGWLLGVHWWSLAGWRWLFFLEGIPAIVLGTVTLFYLTDWPSQAHWLSPPKFSKQSCGLALPTRETDLSRDWPGIRLKQSKFCSARDFPSGRASFYRWRFHFAGPF